MDGKLLMFDRPLYSGRLDNISHFGTVLWAFDQPALLPIMLCILLSSQADQTLTHPPK